MRTGLIVFFCGLNFLTYSQSPKVDSLQRLIDYEGETSRKVELLNELSFAFFDLDVERSNKSTEQALLLADRIGDKRGGAWALAYRGLYFLFSGNLSEAKDHFEQSLTRGKALRDRNIETYSLTQLGNVYRDQGMFDLANQFYHQAIRPALHDQSQYYRSVVFMNLGRFYLTIHEPDSALHAIQEGMRLRASSVNSSLLADAWILIGNCYRGKEDFDEAEKYYQMAFRVSEGEPFIEADYLQNMGEIYFRQGDFQRALENWAKVLSFHRKNQYKYMLADLLFRMGAAFEEQGYFDLANEYLADALKIAEKADYQYLMGGIYNEQGWVYYRSLNFKIALDNNLKAERIFKKLTTEFELANCWDLRGLIERNLQHYDTALQYHEKSLAIRIDLQNKGEISDGNFNLGEFYLKMGKPQMALPYYFKSLTIDRELDNTYGMSLSYNRIGKIYTQLSRFDSAKIYLDKSFALALPISANNIFHDNYYDLASYYEKLGQDKKAIYYYKKYNQLSDSIFSKQTAQSLASYRALYDVERNQQQIELLNKDNQLTKTLVSRQNTILYAAIAGVVALLILASMYYQFNSRLRKLNFSLAEKNEEIQAQAEELIESNHLISSVNENLEERIEQRTSELKQAYNELDTFFYRSSHDFRRPLTTFMGLAEVAKITVKDKMALELFEKVNETAHNLDKMLMKLQSISDLGVEDIVYKQISLEDKFRLEVARVRQELLQKNIRTQISVDPSLEFYSYPALIKIIIENIVENAISFSGRRDPFILLKGYTENDEIIMEVEDNGQGIEQEYIPRVFDMYFRGAEHSKGNGLGLYIVKKTADKLKARVYLQSKAGQGTKISIIFPSRIDT